MNFAEAIFLQREWRTCISGFWIQEQWKLCVMFLNLRLIW